MQQPNAVAAASEGEHARVQVHVPFQIHSDLVSDVRIRFRLAGSAGLPALALVAAVAGLLAGGASAATTTSRQNMLAKPSAVQCPTVDPTTHVVTPAPTSGVDWAGCDLQSANLTNADLDHADLKGAFMENVNLSGADLIDANVEAVTDGSLFVGADASGATFVDGDLTGCDLQNANFSGADLEGIDLMSGILTGAKFDNANLDNTLIFGEPMTGADFTGATLTEVRSGEDTGTPTLPADWQLTGGFLVGPTANLANENLAGFDLTGADLDGTNLAMASLANADLTSANLDGASLTQANLDGATTTGATFANAQWGDTTCPDGSNSDKYVDGCFSALDTTPPSANPEVTAGKVGAHGWYTSPVQVTWHWTDDGTIDALDCTTTSTSSGSGDPVKLTATCTDLAGNVATAIDMVKIDTTMPVVVVTGVRAGHTYIDGAAPTPGCQSKDTVSKIAKPAKLTITSTGAHGVGQFAATCAGAVSVAGTVQARPVKVRYRVSFGFGGFAAPSPGSTIGKSAGSFLASFRLVTAADRPIPSATARWLAAHHLVSVRLSGPSIKARTANCVWSGRTTRFRCLIKIPSAAKTGKSRRYELAAYVTLGEPTSIVPPLGKAANPEIIHFG